MDKQKVLKWIANIENFDGDNLSLGSLRTLGDIKEEITALKEEAQQQADNSACTPLSNIPKDAILCFCKGDFAFFKGVCGNCGKVIDIKLSV